MAPLPPPGPGALTALTLTLCHSITLTLSLLSLHHSLLSHLSQVHDEVTTTWKMLDTEGSGEVDISAIDACFKRLGCAATDTQLREMLRTADENQDGKVSFQEFAVAYHSKTWRRARLLGKGHRLQGGVVCL